MSDSLGKLIRTALIIILAFFYYESALDNFFAWDDFLWLYRAKALHIAPMKMFQLESNSYFDPLVYISFWINHKLFGLSHIAYNIVDISTHIVNSLLVFQLVFKLSNNKLLSFLTSIFFVTAFSTVSAVVWVSARTDLLCTLFVLCSILLYLKFCETERRSLLLLSLASFILALSSKGTAVILPLLLFISGRISGFRQQLKCLMLYLLLSIIYFVLLILHSKPLLIESSTHAVIYNKINNLFLCMATLFIPQETLLSHQSLIYILPFILVLIFFTLRSHMATYGFSLLVIALIPITYVDFQLRLIDWNSPSHYLLATPSHRIYLSSIGASIFMSATIVKVYETIDRKYLKVLLLLSAVGMILTLNYKNIQQMEKMWSLSSFVNKKILYEMKAALPDVKDNCKIVLFARQPISSAFMMPMLKVFYESEGLSYVSLATVPSTIQKNPNGINADIPRNVYAFASSIKNGKFHLYNVTELYNKALTFTYLFKLTTNERERDKLRNKYRIIAAKLNTIIQRGDSL